MSKADGHAIRMALHTMRNIETADEALETAREQFSEKGSEIAAMVGKADRKDIHDQIENYWDDALAIRGAMGIKFGPDPYCDRWQNEFKEIVFGGQDLVLAAAGEPKRTLPQ